MDSQAHDLFLIIKNKYEKGSLDSIEIIMLYFSLKHFTAEEMGQIKNHFGWTFLSGNIFVDWTFEILDLYADSLDWDRVLRQLCPGKIRFNTGGLKKNLFSTNN